MTKKLIIFSVLFIFLMTACTSNHIQVPKPPSAAQSAPDIQVASEYSVFLEETELLSLSPDGKWLFGIRLDTICVFDSANLTEKVCSKWDRSIDPGSLAWSKDSMRVAFSENLAHLLHESDIWVFELSTGTLNNLTNDGLDGDILTADQSGEVNAKEINLDSLPVWSPDGKTIAFVRSIYGTTQQTFICAIEASGGIVTKLINVDETHATAVWRRMHWTLDGKKLLFTITLLDDQTGKNGVWSMDPNGKNSKQLVKAKEGWGYPTLVDVTAKGDKFLIVYPQGIAQASKYANLSFFEVYDLKTNTLTPLKEVTTEFDDPEAAPEEFYSPTQAIFSPDGSKILYHYNLPGSEEPTPQLVVRDVVSSSVEQILANRAIYTPQGGSSVLFWGENDAIYMMTASGLGLVYTLGSK